MPPEGAVHGDMIIKKEKMGPAGGRALQGARWSRQGGGRVLLRWHGRRGAGGSMQVGEGVW